MGKNRVEEHSWLKILWKEKLPSDLSEYIESFKNPILSC